MKANLIEQAYAVAKERYAAIGVDTDAVLDQLQKQQLSLHCWQTDDVVGFERNDALSGGIQTTGNYPGRARTIDEVRQDIEFVKTLLGGNHRLNLHEIYGDFGGKFVDRDQCGVEHFQSWIDWAKENNIPPRSLTRRAATSRCRTPTRRSATSGLSTPSAAAASPTLWVRPRTTPAS